MAHFLHNNWQEENIELSILATGQELGTYHQELGNAGFHVNHIPFSKSIRFVLETFQLLRNSHFDVVHIHAERAFFLYAILAWLNHTAGII